MNHVTDKVILITGASSGIGEASARLLAAHGARVILGARRTEKLNTIVAEIRAAGGNAEAIAVDVRKPADVQAMAELALTRFGRIDVMFNNAGIMPLAPMADLKTTEWNDMVDINIKGVLNGIAAALPVMQLQGNGHIINTASIGAYRVSPNCAVYCATKYAVAAISEGLRQESPTIRVTTLSPGVVETELGHDITHEVTAGFLKEIRKQALSADSIANAVLYAVSQPDDVDVNELIVRATSSEF